MGCCCHQLFDTLPLCSLPTTRRNVAFPAEAGAPWHSQDRQGYTAGEYASGSGRREVVRQLLDWAVKAELILGAAWGGGEGRPVCWGELAPAALYLARQYSVASPGSGPTRPHTLPTSCACDAGTISRRESKGAVPNRDYLGSSIKYEDGRLVDAQGEAPPCAGGGPPMLPPCLAAPISAQSSSCLLPSACPPCCPPSRTCAHRGGRDDGLGDRPDAAACRGDLCGRRRRAQRGLWHGHRGRVHPGAQGEPPPPPLAPYFAAVILQSCLGHDRGFCRRS